MGDLRTFLLSARSDPTIKVVVFQSDNPDFFIAHVDMTLIDDPHAFDDIAREVPACLNVFQALGELVRTVPQGTIVQARGDRSRRGRRVCGCLRHELWRDRARGLWAG